MKRKKKILLERDQQANYEFLKAEASRKRLLKEAFAKNQHLSGKGRSLQQTLEDIGPMKFTDFHSKKEFRGLTRYKDNNRKVFSTSPSPSHLPNSSIPPLN